MFLCCANRTLAGGGCALKFRDDELERGFRTFTTSKYRVLTRNFFLSGMFFLTLWGFIQSNSACIECGNGST